MYKLGGQYKQLESSAPQRGLLFSSCGGLQSSAATKGPLGPKVNMANEQTNGYTDGQKDSLFYIPRTTPTSGVSSLASHQVVPTKNIPLHDPSKNKVASQEF